MKDKFELAGGSIIGREHLRVGKNNQDEQVNSILIGSDGVLDLMEVADKSTLVVIRRKNLSHAEPQSRRE